GSGYRSRSSIAAPKKTSRSTGSERVSRTAASGRHRNSPEKLTRAPDHWVPACAGMTGRAIFKQGTFTERIASASVSIATGRSKLVRHASATLRDGTGDVTATTFSSFEA